MQELAVFHVVSSNRVAYAWVTKSLTPRNSSIGRPVRALVCPAVAFAAAPIKIEIVLRVDIRSVLWFKMVLDELPFAPSFVFVHKAIRTHAFKIASCVLPVFSRIASAKAGVASVESHKPLSYYRRLAAS